MKPLPLISRCWSSVRLKQIILIACFTLPYYICMSIKIILTTYNLRGRPATCRPPPGCSSPREGHWGGTWATNVIVCFYVSCHEQSYVENGPKFTLSSINWLHQNINLIQSMNFKICLGNIKLISYFKTRDFYWKSSLSLIINWFEDSIMPLSNHFVFPIISTILKMDNLNKITISCYCFEGFPNRKWINNLKNT